jgi:hypothetical protein
MTVTNAAASSGGTDAETIEEIRQNAPQSLRVLERCVAREDYEISAEAVSGVARALHLTINEGAGVGENQGILYVVPVDGGTASNTLLDTVAARFEITGATPKTNTYQLTVRSALYATIDVSTTVYFRSGTTPAVGKAAILAGLQEFFAILNDDGTKNEDIDFGFYFKDEDDNPTGEISWSDIFNVVRDAAGIRNVDEGTSGLTLNGERASVEIGNAYFPVLGTLTVVDGSTGLTV